MDMRSGFHFRDNIRYEKSGFFCLGVYDGYLTSGGFIVVFCSYGNSSFTFFYSFYFTVIVYSSDVGFVGSSK